MVIKATDKEGLAQIMKNMDAVSAEKISCGHVLKPGEGGRRFGDQLICTDCYFDKLSDLVEQHPAGRPTPSGR